MPQSWIRAAFYRGGTSKGVFFHARDLPAERAGIDPILLAVLGSPDPYGRQLDGMGGGISSLSKAVIVGPPTRPDCDVDYTFVQLAIDKPIADWSSNCGNLLSAVGPFAVDEQLVRAADGEALVRIHQTNTRKVIHARFPVSGGRAVTDGRYAIAGVAGVGARVRLDFLEPAGAATGSLLPTGNVVDRISLADGRKFDITIIDAATLVAYVAASDLAMSGTEAPEEIDARADVMDTLEQLRRAAGVLAGVAAVPDAIGLQSPRIALVSAPAAFRSIDGQRHGPDTHDIATRMISIGRTHKAILATGSLNLGVATRISGTLPARLARLSPSAEEVRVANPSGLIAVGAEVRRAGSGWQVESAQAFRTARRLMQGEVAVPARLEVRT